MKRAVPPPVLDGARLLAYAAVDGSVSYSGKSALYVDGKAIGAVPGLAIGQQDAATILLLFCDEQWNVIGAVGCSSLSDAKSRAEREYSGLSTKWVNANVTEQEAARYIEGQSGERRCSFCGKAPEAVQQLFAASAARICDGCVREFYETLKVTS